MENAVIYDNGGSNEPPISTVAPNAEVIRGSVVVMVWQLIIFLIFTDVIYALINTFLLKIYFLQLTLPFDLHRNIILLLSVLHIGKSIAQIGFIVTIVFHWVGRYYYIMEKHLIKRQGLFSIKEKIYDLGNIRSVSVKQSFIGKLFHFGDIEIETSAPGGYMDKIIVTGIANPENFEEKLRHCF